MQQAQIKNVSLYDYFPFCTYIVEINIESHVIVGYISIYKPQEDFEDISSKVKISWLLLGHVNKLNV